MMQNHGNIMIYLRQNTSTQIMHTAQNNEQKCEGNITYFQIETLTWWIIADLRNQHIKLLDRALFTGVLTVWRQRLNCLSQVSDGRRGRGERKRDYAQKLKTRTLEEKNPFYSNREWKLLIFSLKLHIKSECCGHRITHSSLPRL